MFGIIEIHWILDSIKEVRCVASYKTEQEAEIAIRGYEHQRVDRFESRYRYIVRIPENININL